MVKCSVEYNIEQQKSIDGRPIYLWGPSSHNYFYPVQFAMGNAVRIASVECFGTTYRFFAPQFEPLTMQQLTKREHDKCKS